MLDPSCCPAEEDLRRFALGTLSEADVARLEQHLGRCAECLRTLSTLEVEDRILESLRGGDRVLPQPNVHVDRLQEKLRLLPEVFLAASEATFMHPALAVGQTPEDARTILRSGPTALAAVRPLPALEQTLADHLAVLAPATAAGEVGQLGPYRILRVLGSGGMGVVFEAQQAHPQRTIAVKMLLAGLDGPYRRRFRQEMEVIARLQHPNIVHIHEVGEHEGRPYFTMEFMDGGDLAQQLAVRPLPPRAAALLIETLARAVQHAHERGFVHRDLKPSNVLLRSDGTAKISDFGLAKSLRPADEGSCCLRTENGAILGTPSYMAPEQAAGAQVGPATDIYALGALLYEALTDRPPFRAATIQETLEQVRTREPTSPSRLQPGVSRELETICLKCLQKEPGRRYGSAAELADDLGRHLRGEPIQARPVGVVEVLGKWIRRKPTLAALLIFSAVLLATLIVSGLLYQARLREAVERAAAEKQEAQRQRELAQKRYETSVVALRDILSREQDPSRLHKMLEDCLAFYRKVQERDDPDLMVRQDTALAFSEVASIQFQLGQTAAAEENFRQAVALLENLPPEQRLHPTCQDRLAEDYTYLATLTGAAGRVEETERLYRRILAIREQFARANPEEAQWQTGLAHAELLLGAFHQGRSQWSDAETHVQRAVALYERASEMSPEAKLIQAARAGAYVRLGGLYRQTGRSDGAGALLARAEELLTPLADANPEDAQYAVSLAAACNVRADCFQEIGRFEEAWQRADRSVELVEKLLRREPRMAIPRALAVDAHHKRAAACQALGRWAEAVRDWDRSIELDEAANTRGWRVLRTMALARAGDHVRAGAEVRFLAEDARNQADDLFLLARAVAVAAGLAYSDARLVSAEREVLRKRYADQAMALLRVLQRRGYFKDPGHARALRTEPDLRPLYAHIDFLKLWLR
jgi:serine/threonine protein kinase